MKKWLFSDNGEVTGPFGLDESNELVSKNPDLYAWHPVYTHWVPVSCINEFEVAATPPPPPIELPTNLIDDLVGEEKELITTLDRIDKTIKITSDSLYEIDTDLEHYGKTAENLTAQVKDVVKAIEEQYASLQKNLANVIKTDY